MSITGVVYVQSQWPPRGAAEASAANARADRLLRSIDGLADKLAGVQLPVCQQTDDVARLASVRHATEAGYFNEGVPLSKLRDEGIWLPPE